MTFSASTEYCKIGKEKHLVEKVLDKIIHYRTSKYKQRLVKKIIKLVASCIINYRNIFGNISAIVHQQETELNLPLLATEEVPLQKAQ